MMKTVARVRRDGQAVEIDAEELVPGDIVLVEAGNRVPADGRICRRRDAGDRGGRAHRREPAGRQERRRRSPGDGRAARRPDLHGLHEHVGDPGPRRDDRHRDRHGHRDRPHRRPAGRTPRPTRRRCRSSSTACRRSSRPSPGSRWSSSSSSGWSAASRSTRCSSPVSRWRSRPSRPDCPRSSPRCCPSGTREIARPQRDRQAAAGGGDARLDLGDLLGQDRHADAEQDDRAGAGDPGPAPVHGLRRGLPHRRARSSTSAASRIDLDPYLLPMVAVRRRRARRREPDRRPDRGRADRAGGQGRAGHRRDPRAPTRGSPRCRSTRSTSSWPPSTR